MSYTAEGMSPQEDMSSCLHMLDTFEVRPEILRGVQLSATLGDLGGSWRISPIDLPDHRRRVLWQKSFQCERIDAFISQTWQSRGSERYLALLMREYWVYSVGAGLMSLLVLATLDLHGKLPTLGDVDALRLGWDGVARPSPWCSLPPLVSFIVLFLSPWFPALRSRIIFFDAVCINQSDERLKKEGISSLGGFVAKSDEFIMLWSRAYFQRAWCTFELAVFLALRKDGVIHFYPLFVTTTMFAGVLISFAWLTLFNVTDVLNMTIAPKSFTWLLRSIVLLPLPIFVHRLRQFNMDVSSLKLQLTNFNFDEAKCREACDLDFIKGAVCKLYGSVDEFNAFVRTSLRHKVLDLERSSEFSFRHCFTIALPFVGFAVQQLVSFIRAGGGSSPVSFLLIASANAVSVGLIFPACLKLVFEVCKMYAKPHPSIIADVACSIAISVVMLLAVISFYAATVAVSNLVSLGSLVVVVLGCVFAGVIFRSDIAIVVGKGATVAKILYTDMRRKTASAEAASGA